MRRKGLTGNRTLLGLQKQSGPRSTAATGEQKIVLLCYWRPRGPASSPNGFMYIQASRWEEKKTNRAPGGFDRSKSQDLVQP